MTLDFSDDVLYQRRHDVIESKEWETWKIAIVREFQRCPYLLKMLSEVKEQYTGELHELAKYAQGGEEMRARDEFEYNAILQQISKITQIMLGWRTIAVAAAIALPSAGKYIQLTTISPDYYLPFGYIGAAVLILWYIIDISYDRQIVKDYYPKVRELETKLKIEVYRDAWHETKWNLWGSLYKRKRYINLCILGVYVVVLLYLYLIK